MCSDKIESAIYINENCNTNVIDESLENYNTNPTDNFLENNSESLLVKLPETKIENRNVMTKEITENETKKREKPEKEI